MKKAVLRVIGFVFSIFIIYCVMSNPICRERSIVQNQAVAMPAINYKEEMILLIEQISLYAKARNRSFQVIGNNGLELFQPEEVSGNSLMRLLNSIDGIAMESFHYGWEMKDDIRTPSAVRAKLERALAVPLIHKLPIFNIDYCKDRQNSEKSYQLNDKSGFIAFAADSRQLDTIPPYPGKIHRENDSDIHNLQQAKNFLVILNPQNFADKRSYLQKLRNTNYDLLIIDLYFNSEPLSSAEVASLKIKKNGAYRLVFAYMSVGEAEEYRPYWQGAWSQFPPDWIMEKNPDWTGNRKVKYWTEDWKRLLFGSTDAYLDMILAKDFDGVFMDVIDAFEYFEDKQ